MRLLISALRRYALAVGMAVIPFSSVRVILLRICGVKIGSGCYVGFHVICDTNFAEKITIGDNVTISHGTQIYTHTMTPDDALGMGLVLLLRLGSVAMMCCKSPCR